MKLVKNNKLELDNGFVISFEQLFKAVEEGYAGIFVYEDDNFVKRMPTIVLGKLLYDLSPTADVVHILAGQSVSYTHAIQLLVQENISDDKALLVTRAFSADASREYFLVDPSLFIEDYNTMAVAV